MTRSLLLVSGRTRRGSVNFAVPRTALAKVLGYVGAEIVEPACLRLPVRRDALGANGVIHDAEIQGSIADVVQTLLDAADRAAGR